MFPYMSVKKVLQKASAIQKDSVTLFSDIVYIKALILASWCSFWQTMTFKNKKRQGE